MNTTLKPRPLDPHLDRFFASLRRLGRRVAGKQNSPRPASLTERIASAEQIQALQDKYAKGKEA